MVCLWLDGDNDSRTGAASAARLRDLPARFLAEVYPRLLYCALMPAALITLADSSISARTKFLNSAGVIGIGSAPRLANRSLTSADCSRRATSLLILSTMSGGVPAGAKTPTHRL